MSCGCQVVDLSNPVAFYTIIRAQCSPACPRSPLTWIELFQFPPVGDVAGGVVIGSVGGDSNPNIGDGYDVFAPIQALGANYLYIGLESYETIANNADSQLDVYDFGGGLVYSATISEVDVGVNLVDEIFDQFPTDFAVVLAVSEFDVVGQGYSIRVLAETPEPSTSIVITIIMLGLIGLRKR